jgi:copper chaperone
MSTVTYKIPSIHCGHCTHTIEMELGELEGVESVRADLESKQVTVVFNPPADDTKVRALLTEIEYPAAV